jgi:hypothetical protein
VESQVVAKYEVTTNRCIVYVRRLFAGEPIRFDYELKPSHPIRAQIPVSTVYEYYQPGNRDQTEAAEIVVE